MSRFTKYRKKSHVPKSWEDVYHLPLHLDDYASFAWDKYGNMALSSFANDDESDNPDYGKEARHIVAIINGEIPSDYEPEWAEGEKDTSITYKDKYRFLVRGWGHLTGCGALNLPPKVAADLQDQFIQYIIDKLNGTK